MEAWGYLKRWNLEILLTSWSYKKLPEWHINSVQTLTSNLLPFSFTNACSLGLICSLDRVCGRTLQLEGVSKGHGSALLPSGRWSRDGEKRPQDEEGLAQKQTPMQNVGSDGSPPAWQDTLSTAQAASPFWSLSTAFLLPRSTQALCLSESGENRWTVPAPLKGLGGERSSGDGDTWTEPALQSVRSL